MHTFCVFPFVVMAQNEKTPRPVFEPKSGFICQFTYTYQVPGGDMAKRFGNNSALGTGVYYKTFDNWLFGVEGNYLFAPVVKETGIFNAIVNENGQAVDENGFFVPINVTERAFNLMAKVGKIIPFNKRNENSGLMISVGVGFLEHKIRIDNTTRGVVALQGDLGKGYDRLTNGLAVNQFIGYQYLDKRKRVNFFAGFEFYQAFTQNRRNWNYDMMRPDTAPRKDFLYGLRVGWLLPIYSTRSADSEYMFK